MDSKDSALILFSGQKDSIDVLMNYAQKYNKRNISLLYIKNVGFRNNYKVPLQLAKEMMNVCPNILYCYVVDGREIQISLIKYFAQKLNDISYIQILCLICQFCLNYVYVNISSALNFKHLLSYEEVLGETLKEILGIPYSCVEIKKESFKKYSTKNEYRDKCEIIENKCQLAYLHNYCFNTRELKYEDISEILQSFISSYAPELKYKKYNLR